MRMDTKQLAVGSATIGTSLATLAFGFGSPIYYASFLLAVGIAATSVARHGDRTSGLTIVMIGVFAYHSIMVMLHNPRPENDPTYGDVVRLAPLVAVCLLGDCVRRLGQDRFARVMMWTAILHVPILLATYWFARGDLTGGVRLSAENVKVAALAEIAIGTAWAGLLSRNWAVAILSVTTSLLIIYLTQMRTAGVAVTITLMVLVFAKYSIMRKTKVRILVVLSIISFTVVVVVAKFSGIVDAVFRILLLNDQHRGLSSGFSGRGENIAAGWFSFMERPVFGFGATDPIVNYTHNGFVLTLAQFGLPIALICFAFLLLALLRSWKAGSIVLFAVVSGLLVFYMGQPRNINTQLCPLIGILSAFRAIPMMAKSKLGFSNQLAFFR